MKNKSLIISLIIILTILAIFLILFMVGLLNNKITFFGFKFNYKVSSELVLDNTYEFDSNKIEINSEASDIYIKYSNDNTTRVVIYGNKDNTKVETINNDIFIYSNEEKCFGFCLNKRIAKIEIYLPSTYDKDILIKNKFGDIEITEFLKANINVEENCGDVLISGGNIIDAINKYGDIKINKANEIKIDAKAGDVKITSVNDVIVNNALGDIEISNVKNYLKIENNCGDIKVNNISLNKDSYIKGDLGDIKIGNTNEIYIDAKTSLGDIDINNNYNKSDITLKIENSCGDIEVNN